MTDEQQYDPADHKVADVVEHLEGSDSDERARVIALEEAGQKRKGIVEWSPSADTELAPDADGYVRRPVNGYPDRPPLKV